MATALLAISPALAFVNLASTSSLQKPAFSPCILFMAMSELPSEVEQYSIVPALEDYFTATTIPPGLLKGHSTKDGTWGVIRVNQGLLEYTLEDSNEVFQLSKDLQGVIEPNVQHHVKAMSDDVEFLVEFYRKTNTGPVDEPREGL